MKREKIFRSEHGVTDLWDNVRRSNMMIIRGPEETEKTGQKM